LRLLLDLLVDVPDEEVLRGVIVDLDGDVHEVVDVAR
jgi:hypothetical protein